MILSFWYSSVCFLVLDISNSAGDIAVAAAAKSLQSCPTLATP